MPKKLNSLQEIDALTIDNVGQFTIVGSGDKFNTVAGIIEAWGALMVKQAHDALNKPIQRNPKTSAPMVNTGRLSDSLKFQIKYFGKQYNWQLLAEDYFYWVDKGRESGGVDPDIIRKWVIQKMRKGAFGGKLTTKNNKIIPNEAKVKKLTELISWKITKRGYKGNKFLTNTVTPKAIQSLVKAMAIAGGHDVKVEIVNEFKKKK